MYFTSYPGYGTLQWPKEWIQKIRQMKAPANVIDNLQTDFMADTVSINVISLFCSVQIAPLHNIFIISNYALMKKARESNFRWKKIFFKLFFKTLFKMMIDEIPCWCSNTGSIIIFHRDQLYLTLIFSVPSHHMLKMIKNIHHHQKPAPSMIHRLKTFLRIPWWLLIFIFF